MSKQTNLPLSMAELEELDDKTSGQSLEDLDGNGEGLKDDEGTDTDAPVPSLKKKVGNTDDSDDSDDKDTPKRKDSKSADDEEEEEEDKDNKGKSEKGEGDGGDGDGSDVAAFYAEVDEKRGEVIEVDYGDVDPMSPEGVYLREKAVEDYGADKFEKVLETNYPSAYAYFVHLASGKPAEDFFSSAPAELPTVEELRVDENKQEEIILLHLQNKGLKADKAARYLNSLSEEDKIVEAEEALANELAAKDERDRKAKKEYEEKVQADNERINQFSSKLDEEIVAKGKIGNVTIPAKDRAAFSQFLKANTSYVDGKFIIATEVTDEKLPGIIQQQFLAFKNGNLSDLVQEKATTKNTIRAKFTKTQTKQLKDKQDPKVGGLTLGDL